MLPSASDVVIVGAGNAAFCAALAAAESGVSVLVLERAPANESGGNSRFTDRGIRFIPTDGRQAYKIDGKFKFWGGLTVEAWGGGPGLVEAHTTIAKKIGVT